MALNKNGTGYMYGFALGITVLCGILLASVSEATKDARLINVKVEKMSNILATVNYPIDKNSTNEDIEKAYNELISEVVVDESGAIREGAKAFDVDLKEENTKVRNDASYQKNLPVFVYQNPETGAKNYVVPMRGNGLWGAVWGYIALADDLNTVVGVKFDHESETPGLGAEITTDWFQTQFPDKKVFDDNGNMVLTILKGKGNALGQHTVDGISGATITGNGVNNMFKADLKQYNAYFNQLKTAQ
jgi:Na+-transporting NADH:ubiquinone oxidoreductase subunit C